MRCYRETCQKEPNWMVEDLEHDIVSASCHEDLPNLVKNLRVFIGSKFGLEGASAKEKERELAKTDTR